MKSYHFPAAVSVITYPHCSALKQILLAFAVFKGIASMAAQPVITSQPRAATTILGGQAVFAVEATGEAPIRYQWSKNGAALPEATNDTLFLRGALFRDEAAYVVTVSNVRGSAISDPAQLSVRAPRAGDPDVTFNPGSRINGKVNSLTLQADGKILIDGSFTSVGGATRAGIARLNRDGSTDYTFVPELSDEKVQGRLLTVQPDGKILVVSRLDDWGTYRFERLRSNGTLDPTFRRNPPALGGSKLTDRGWIIPGIWSVKVQPDGRILVAGYFTSVDGTARGSIARLNADGSLDQEFMAGVAGVAEADPTVWCTVWCMALQPDEKLIVGGRFEYVNGISRRRIARLNGDGSLDRSFLEDMSGVGQLEPASQDTQDQVLTVVIQDDRKVLIGGWFFLVNGVARAGLVRLNADGSLDEAFQPALTWAISTIGLDPDGKVLVGTEQGIGRLKPDGTLDKPLSKGSLQTGGGIGCIAVEPEGTVLVGGWAGVGRLDRNLDWDTDFGNGSSGVGQVRVVIRQPDGKVLLGGASYSVNGVAHNGIARLNVDGSLDSAFADGVSGVDDSLICMALQPDGRVLIAGRFRSVNGVSRNSLARLHPDGSLDTGFLDGLSGVEFPIGVAGVVYSVAVQPDGRILIGGTFRFVNGVARNSIARLKPDGTLDEAFLNGGGGVPFSVNYMIEVVKLQSDGKVLLGGDFTEINGLQRNRIARLNPDGSLDAPFGDGLAGCDGEVFDIETMDDGRILVGGYFGQVNGENRSGIARLYPDGTVDKDFSIPLNCLAQDLVLRSDGKILITGAFTYVGMTSRPGIARFQPDGALDTLFMQDTLPLRGSAITLALEPDGRILVGGNFGGFDAWPASGIVRIHEESPAWSPELSLGLVSGAPQLRVFGEAGTGVVVEKSPDLKTWEPFATNTAASGGVSLPGVAPSGQNCFFRARQPR